MRTAAAIALVVGALALGFGAGYWVRGADSPQADEDASSSLAASSTTVLRPYADEVVARLREVEPGGVEDTDLRTEFCRSSRRDVVDAAIRLGYAEAPQDLVPLNRWERWMEGSPDEFDAACRNAVEQGGESWDGFVEGERKRRREAVLAQERIALREDFDRILSVELTDAERVWCFDNGGRVRSAAETLGLYEADDDFQDWQLLAPLDLVRACQVAFSAR